MSEKDGCNCTLKFAPNKNKIERKPGKPDETRHKARILFISAMLVKLDPT